ncbi:MAG: PRC-barrel domain-containing protein [Planctomycetia bacterium]|nr:PRC-barrel domain-containing protein [Planctomycetia bacterium]
MKRIMAAGVIALAGLLWTDASVRAEDKPAATGRAEVYQTGHLLDKKVRNLKGEDIGQIEDFVVDIKTGQIVYAVLAYGETLGFGGKLFALPAERIKMADDLSAVIVDVPKDTLDKAKGFDANVWPKVPDALFATQPAGADKAPVIEPKPAANDKDDAGRAHMVRVTAIKGMNVKSPKGQDLGNINGLALDLKNRKIVYAALSHGGVAGVGAKLFAIPWDALRLEGLTLKPGERVLVLNAAKETFDNIPGFDANNWPTTADQRFTKEKLEKN